MIISNSKNELQKAAFILEEFCKTTGKEEAFERFDAVLKEFSECLDLDITVILTT